MFVSPVSFCKSTHTSLVDDVQIDFLTFSTNKLHTKDGTPPLYTEASSSQSELIVVDFIEFRSSWGNFIVFRKRTQQENLMWNLGFILSE